MEEILRRMTLGFFGSGKHKITPEEFFEVDDAVFIDVRSKEEAESVSIRLEHHSNIISLQIPIDEIPDRIGEIPQAKLIGVFCPEHVRSAIALSYLLFKGFENVCIVMGGYQELTNMLKPGNIWKLMQAKEKK